jgi:hypothetical protein
MGRSRHKLVRGIRSILGQGGRAVTGLSREAVISGFRHYLGRDPESEAVIAAHQSLPDEAALARCLIGSPEYAQKQRAARMGKPQSTAPEAPSVPQRRHITSSLRFLIFGNCQAPQIARLIEAMTGGATTIVIETTSATIARLRSGEQDISPQLAGNDLILTQEFSEIYQIIEQRYPQALPKVRRFPSVNFNAYHPDIVYVVDKAGGGYIQGPMGEYQSAIALWAWTQGLGIAETLDLFRAEVFDALGYFDYWPSAVQELERIGERAGIPLGDLLEGWRRQGCWLYTLNHPKQPVLADVVRRVLRRDGIDPIPDVETYLPDALAIHPAWPVYPEIAQRLGVPGHYLFKLAAGMGSVNNPAPVMGLHDFVAASFETFGRYGTQRLACDRLASSRFEGIKTLLRTSLASGLTTPRDDGPTSPQANAQQASPSEVNPYRDLPDYRFWRRAIERIALQDIDPVVHPRFTLGKDDKVATAGSCFAQHISRTLRSHGFRFLVTEEATGLEAEEARRRQFDIFTARYGNVYTARQLLQLFDRAFGHFEPVDGCWIRADGRFVDAFRPQVEPDGFATIEELALARETHLKAVRQMFEQLNVMVFTLGLTEAWRSRIDGAVYPLAPGVIAGTPNAQRYEFVNFEVRDVTVDLQAFIARLRGINPSARVILTVSPVPLIATYEDRHALVSTTYSKAVLRVAAEEVIRGDLRSDYFPSYELITGNHTRGAYFEDDLRSVTTSGVEHAMRLFLSHYLGAHTSSTLAEELEREARAVRAIVCDEEAIDAGNCTRG